MSSVERRDNGPIGRDTFLVFRGCEKRLALRTLQLADARREGRRFIQVTLINVVDKAVKAFEQEYPLMDLADYSDNIDITMHNFGSSNLQSFLISQASIDAKEKVMKSYRNMEREKHANCCKGSKANHMKGQCLLSSFLFLVSKVLFFNLSRFWNSKHFTFP